MWSPNVNKSNCFKSLYVPEPKVTVTV